MISNTIERGVLALKRAVTAVFVALGIPPNVLTLASLVPTGLAAVRMAGGALTEAALWIILAGFFDVIDGAVARATNRLSSFGGVLDSVTDRASDIFIYAGAVGYFHNVDAPLYEALSYVAMGGALMVSYTRARAENTVLDCKVGFAERGERMVLLLLALFFDRLGPGMWMLAGLAWLTTLQRLIHTRRAVALGQLRDPVTKA